MTEVQIPAIPITSPLQLLTMPLDMLNRMQSEMMLATMRAMGGDTGEEVAEEEVVVISEAKRAMKVVEPDRMLRRNNATIHKSEKILDEDIPGHLDEVVIKSTSDFSIELSIDGRLLIHETMSELIDMSDDIISIVAMLADGVYRFNMSDLTYNRLFLRVFLSGSGTFDIFYKLRRDPYAD